MGREGEGVRRQGHGSGDADSVNLVVVEIPEIAGHLSHRPWLMSIAVSEDVDLPQGLLRRRLPVADRAFPFFRLSFKEKEKKRRFQLVVWWLVSLTQSNRIEVSSGSC
ncbi:unnamed protein product [Urochloa humidicola]